jgi:hypothetical protein
MLATSRSAMLQPSYAVLAVRHDPVPPRRGPGGAGHPQGPSTKPGCIPSSGSAPAAPKRYKLLNLEHSDAMLR